MNEDISVVFTSVCSTSCSYVARSMYVYTSVETLLEMYDMMLNIVYSVTNMLENICKAADHSGSAFKRMN
jgi:hypothetical protein